MGSWISRRGLIKAAARLGIAASAADMLAPFGVMRALGAEAAEDMAAIEAAAHGEGGVTLYTFAENVDISTMFKAAYPWTELSSFAFPTAAQVKAKFLTEKRAGANIADLVMIHSADYPSFRAEDSSAATDLPNAAHTVKGILDPTHHLHAMFQVLFIYAYNPNVGVTPPRDPFELADPAWKGKLAFDSPSNGSASAMFLASRRAQWGDEKWRQWLAGLAANDVLETASAAAAYSAVLQGQRSLAICGYQSVLGQKPGTPMVAGFYDKLVASVTYAFLSSNAPHPNTAKVFLNWLMGPEVQAEYSREGWIPASDIDTPTSLSRLVPKGEVLGSQDDVMDFFEHQADYLKIYKEYWPL